MLTPMTREELDTLDDRALIVACLAPVIARIRGRGLDVKSATVGALAPAQRALLAFHVLHGHASDINSFWHYVRLYLHEWRVWPLVEDSARYFDDARLLAVYRAVAAADGEDAALFQAYHAAADRTVRIAAEHIRAHPDRFVALS